jgi:hypothetical protein
MNSWSGGQELKVSKSNIWLFCIFLVNAVLVFAKDARSSATFLGQEHSGFQAVNASFDACQSLVTLEATGSVAKQASTVIPPPSQ